MRSYATARRSFSFLETFARVLVGVGCLSLIPVFMALELRGAVALLGAIPGVGIIAMGFFGIAYVQTARAAVDSAEYAQQSLSLAREQHEISKQMLRMAQTSQPGATYAPPTEPEALKDNSFDTAEPTPVAAPPMPALPVVKGELMLHEYGGIKIEEQDGVFLIEDKSYNSLIDAKLAVDGARLRAKVSKM